MQFWETYDNNEAYPHLETANKIAARLKAASEGTDKKDDTASVSNAGIDLLATNSAVNDSAKADTSKAGLTDLSQATATADTTKKDSTQQKSQEQLRKENPLWAVLSPNADKDNKAVPGSVVGFSSIKDTAKVNSILNMPEVVNALPSTIKFLWDAKGVGKKEEVL